MEFFHNIVVIEKKQSRSSNIFPVVNPQTPVKGGEEGRTGKV
jgi:hypothetical protein